MDLRDVHESAVSADDQTHGTALARSAVLLLLLGCACATPAGKPRLETLEVRVGLSQPEIERVVRDSLSELSRCLAFASWSGGKIVKMEALERYDDRVEVTVFRNELAGESESDADEGPFKATVVGILSDPDCVTRLIEQWPWPKEQTDAVRLLQDRTGALFKFVYRFRPTAAAREDARRENQASLDVFCNTKRESDLGQHFMAVEGRMKGSIRDALQRLLRVLGHAKPEDRDSIFVGALGELTQQYDLKPECAATRGIKGD